MHLPPALLHSLKNVKGFDKKAFEQVHLSGEAVTSIRINPAKVSNDPHSFPFSFSASSPVPWSSLGYYLEKRPSFTFDPLFHAGCYYVQEASSMFLEQAIKQTVDLSQPLIVLDLCAAPGGKSTHLQSIITADSLLVANEVIRGRVHVLVQNITKWGAQNVWVSHNDPKQFARAQGFFDVMVVDAPCSGSGLFRKDEAAIGEWSMANVALCSQRQQRILADALPALKQNGVLIYSTCSYSEEENEEIGDWLMEEMDMESLRLSVNDSWGIAETESGKGAYGYRFFPHTLKGEGFYLSCFRKRSDASPPKQKPIKKESITKGEEEVVKKWMKEKDTALIKNRDSIYALLPSHIASFLYLRQLLTFFYSGTEVGQVLHHKLVPAHGLALSRMVSDAVPSFSCSYEEAIKYLQRQDIRPAALAPSEKGWQRITYKNHPLGWINVLLNRINNYYPKEMRILKQHNDSNF